MNEYLLIHVINMGGHNAKLFVQFQLVRMNKIQSFFFPISKLSRNAILFTNYSISTLIVFIYIILCQNKLNIYETIGFLLFSNIKRGFANSGKVFPTGLFFPYEKTSGLGGNFPNCYVTK